MAVKLAAAPPDSSARSNMSDVLVDMSDVLVDMSDVLVDMSDVLVDIAAKLAARSG
jgi:hypothetical protein